MMHRGPDAEDEFVDNTGTVFLGYGRLAIVDISGGEQPTWNEDRKVGVVFNDEIYNHAELRDELTRHGHCFASNHSDVEVLVERGFPRQEATEATIVNTFERCADIRRGLGRAEKPTGGIRLQRAGEARRRARSNYPAGAVSLAAHALAPLTGLAPPSPSAASGCPRLDLARHETDRPIV